MPNPESPYNAEHVRARRRLLAAPGVVCIHCGAPFPVVADHQPPLSLHQHRNNTGCCVLVPSCMKCSRKQAGELTTRTQRFGVPVVERVDPEGYPADHGVWDVPWLDEIRNVPDEGTWPRLMSIPHTKAVGSYGNDAAEWLRTEGEIDLRWWQRLSLLRMLEHDKTGMLVWLNVLLTTSRQSGKSTLLRGVAMWRMHQSQLFGETQLVLHTGKDLPVCTEVQRQARPWARMRHLRVREANGAEAIENDADGSRWLIRGKGSVYGYPASMALVDEAWGTQPEIVEDGIEPTMMERNSPQMLLTSTAHRRATPLFMTRRSSVLADLTCCDDALLLEWSAHRGSDIADRDAWRLASPHWSPPRQRLLEARLARVTAGESVDVNEVDPVESFKAQFLNIWPAQLEPAQAGMPLATAPQWDALRLPAEAAQTPCERLWVAVEDNYGDGAAVAAAALRESGIVEVDGWLSGTLEDAMLDAKSVIAQYPSVPSKLYIGASVAKRYRQATAMGATECRQGLPALRAAINEGRVSHDGSSSALAQQLMDVRVRAISGGLIIVPGKRADIVRALSWAMREAVAPAPLPAVR